MTTSIWEQLGERVGYGLAAIVLGPHAALKRRERRALRAAFLEWSAKLEPTKLAAERGTLRRSLTLRLGGEPFVLEAALDLEARSVVILLPLERLPSFVEARITRSTRSLDGMPPFAHEPRATAGDFRLDSDSLDLEAATALVASIATGPLDRTVALDIELTPEWIELRAAPPTAVDGWSSLGEGAVGIATWLSRRWPSSYRG